LIIIISRWRTGSTGTKCHFNNETKPCSGSPNGTVAPIT